MKKNCEIIKDLLPSYIEGILSDETQNYIEEHLCNCVECTELLQKMRRNNTNKELTKNDKIEFDYLKKYKLKLSIFKFLLLSIVFFILLILTIFIFKYKYTVNLMNNVINTIENQKVSNDYSIECIQHEIDYERNTDNTFYTTYYYKNGLYKKKSYFKDSNSTVQNTTYTYGEINSDEKMEIFDNSNIIYKNFSPHNIVKKGQFFDLLTNEIDIFKQDFGFINNIKMKSGYKFRNERFLGRDCVVLKTTEKCCYTEYWIDKENKILIRVIQDIYNRMYSEKVYNVIFDNISDNDVNIQNEEDYTIETIN